LITQRGPEIGRRYDLAAAQFTIGRGTDNDLVLGDAMVSRYHAVIRQENEGVVIIDLGSTNVTTVNETDLEPGVAQRLQHRDVIGIGQNVFCYQQPTGVSAAPPAAGRPGGPHTVAASVRPDAGAPAARPAPASDLPPPDLPPLPKPPLAAVPWEAEPPLPPPPSVPPPWAADPPPAAPVSPDEARTVISSRPGAASNPPPPPPVPSPFTTPGSPGDETPTMTPRKPPGH
jgi:predicted component of type VI protein secretion system